VSYRARPFSDARPHLVAPARRDPSGLTGPTATQIRRGDFRRTSQGFWVPTGTRRTTEQRIADAGAMLPPGGAITGWAGLHWLRAAWFEGVTARGEPRPVPLAVGSHEIRRQDGLLPKCERMAPDEVEVVDGLPVTSVARSVLYEMRHADTLREAVNAADMAAYSDLVDATELAAYSERQWTMSGIPQAREAIQRMEENCWSPAEVGPRLLWSEAGMTPLLCNRPVFDLAGRHVATPDLLDAEAGVAYEWEGAVHLEAKRRSVDVRREERMRGVGLEVMTLLAGDHRDDGELLARMLRVRSRALRTGAERAWTLDLPGWWTPTFTVAQRRALDEQQRSRLLKYRRTA
jgi:hypothetical protein